MAPLPLTHMSSAASRCDLGLVPGLRSQRWSVPCSLRSGGCGGCGPTPCPGKAPLRRDPHVPPLSMAPGDIYGTLAPYQALNWVLDLPACPLSPRPSGKPLGVSARHVVRVPPEGGPAVSPVSEPPAPRELLGTLRTAAAAPGGGLAQRVGWRAARMFPPCGQSPLAGAAFETQNKLSSSKLKQPQL